MFEKSSGWGLKLQLQYPGDCGIMNANDCNGVAVRKRSLNCGCCRNERNDRRYGSDRTISAGRKYGGSESRGF